MDSPSQQTSCGCRNSSDYTNSNTEANWKPENGMHAVSYAFGREEEGTVLGDIEAVLCECIFTFMAKYAAFQKISPDS